MPLYIRPLVGVGCGPIPVGRSAGLRRDCWSSLSRPGGRSYRSADRSLDKHGTPFADDPLFQVHEVVTGPMNAGLFPNRDFDTSLGTESLFFYGPASFDAVSSYEEARPWMNFGAASIDADGKLSLSVIAVDGNPVYTSTLNPQ